MSAHACELAPTLTNPIKWNLNFKGIWKNKNCEWKWLCDVCSNGLMLWYLRKLTPTQQSACFFWRIYTENIACNLFLKATGKRFLKYVLGHTSGPDSFPGVHIIKFSSIFLKISISVSEKSLINTVVDRYGMKGMIEIPLQWFYVSLCPNVNFSKPILIDVEFWGRLLGIP